MEAVSASLPFSSLETLLTLHPFSGILLPLSPHQTSCQFYLSLKTTGSNFTSFGFVFSNPLNNLKPLYDGSQFILTVFQIQYSSYIPHKFLCNYFSICTCGIKLKSWNTVVIQLMIVELINLLYPLKF